MMRLRPLLLCLPLALLAAPAAAQDDALEFDLIPEEDKEDAPSPPPEAAPEPAVDLDEKKPEKKEATSKELEDELEAKNLTRYDRIRAVSRRTFLKRERFALMPMVGQSVNDPFFTRYSVGGRAAYHVVEDLSLEVGGAYLATLNNRQTLRKVAEQENAITVDNPPVALIDAGVTFSPIYGKVAVANDWVVHFDAFVSAGAGVIIDTAQPNPTMQVGIGARVFVLDWLVIRGDVRDYIYPSEAGSLSTLQTLLMVNVGVEIYIPFGFEYRNLAFKIVG